MRQTAGLQNNTGSVDDSLHIALGDSIGLRSMWCRNIVEPLERKSRGCELLGPIGIKSANRRPASKLAQCVSGIIGVLGFGRETANPASRTVEHCQSSAFVVASFFIGRSDDDVVGCYQVAKFGRNILLVILAGTFDSAT
jgi:hypothetical protein